MRRSALLLLLCSCATNLSAQDQLWEIREAKLNEAAALQDSKVVVRLQADLQQAVASVTTDREEALHALEIRVAKTLETMAAADLLGRDRLERQLADLQEAVVQAERDAALQRESEHLA